MLEFQKVQWRLKSKPQIMEKEKTVFFIQIIKHLNDIVMYDVTPNNQWGSYQCFSRSRGYLVIDLKGFNHIAFSVFILCS